MTKPVITCFSNSFENIDNLICKLHEYYGSAINQTIFQEKASLINALRKNSQLCNETQLFALDINPTDNDYVNFLKDIISYSPTSTKIIIAEDNQLTNIKNSVKNNGSLLFLLKPWNGEDLGHILNIASETFTSCCVEHNECNSKLNHDDSIEENRNKELQKLIDANIAKDSFLSIISHDLKSPFVALQGMSEILLNDWKTLTDETKLELIEDLHKTSVDTFKLLESLLEWTKLHKDKLILTVNKIEINSLVDSTLKVLKNNALVKGIKIENKVDKNITVQTDKNIIATIFRNLISNAVQYTPSGGKIEITAKQNKESYTFCVADNGLGIDQPHILELFKKGKNTNINGNASAFKGLGLIICKDFVEKCGGQIWLETKRGNGSKFYFTVPNLYIKSVKLIHPKTNVTLLQE